MKTNKFLRLFCLLIALCLMISSFPVFNASADSIPVSDNEIVDFNFSTYTIEQLQSEWYDLEGGKWKIEEGLLKQTRVGSNWNTMQLNYTEKLFGDFTAKMKFKVDAENGDQGWFGFMFRRTDKTHWQEKSGYGVVSEGPKSNPAGKTYLINWSVGSAAFEDYMFGVDQTDFVEMVVVVKGSEVSCYVNDAINTGEADFTLEVDSLPDPGYIGIAAGNARISLEYLTIYTGDKQEGIVKSSVSDESVDNYSMTVTTTKTFDYLPLICLIIGGIGVIVTAVVFIKNSKGVNKDEK